MTGITLDCNNNNKLMFKNKRKRRTRSFQHGSNVFASLFYSHSHLSRRLLDRHSLDEPSEMVQFLVRDSHVSGSKDQGGWTCRDCVTGMALCDYTIPQFLCILWSSLFAILKGGFEEGRQERVFLLERIRFLECIWFLLLEEDG